MGLTALKPFVPSGKDFGLAKSYFLDLGFKVNWEAPGYAELQHGSATFILQELDNQVVQDNFVIFVQVDDLDAWWKHIATPEFSIAFQALEPNLLPTIRGAAVKFT